MIKSTMDCYEHLQNTFTPTDAEQVTNHLEYVTTAAVLTFVAVTSTEVARSVFGVGCINFSGGCIPTVLPSIAAAIGTTAFLLKDTLKEVGSGIRAVDKLRNFVKDSAKYANATTPYQGTISHETAKQSLSFVSHARMFLTEALLAGGAVELLQQQGTKYFYIGNYKITNWALLGVVVPATIHIYNFWRKYPAIMELCSYWRDQKERKEKGESSKNLKE